LTVAQRNDLLASMSDEVAALVLRDNYEQNVAIAASQAQASSLLHVHRRYVSALVADGVLDRTIEHLPDEAGLDERRAAGIGLTGPEFAVLLAYTKISLTNELLETTLPDDPYLREQLMEYFPRPLREQYAARIDEHPLRREIIVTGLVNHVVNFAGTTFAFRVTEETAANAPEIMAAFLVVFEVFGIPALRADVEALDNKVDAAALISIVLEVRKLTERATRWLLHNRRPPFDIAATIEEFGPGVRAVLPVLPGLLTGDDREGFDARRDRLVGGGVPRSIAERSATAVPAFAVLDLVDIGERTGVAVTDVAACYFYLGERLAISALRDRVTALPRDDRWHTMARNSLRDDVYASHAALCEQVLRCAGPAATQEERFAVWAERNHSANERARLTLADIAEVDKPDVATLSIAVRTLRTLATAGTRTPG
ncbi:MAG: NAD-glutamate dehydrogenase domain-containing protein, partial [Mycobacteriales bacterium]